MSGFGADTVNCFGDLGQFNMLKVDEETRRANKCPLTCKAPEDTYHSASCDVQVEVTRVLGGCVAAGTERPCRGASTRECAFALWVIVYCLEGLLSQRVHLPRVG